MHLSGAGSAVAGTPIARLKEHRHRIAGEGDDVAPVHVEGSDQRVEVIRENRVQLLGTARWAER